MRRDYIMRIGAVVYRDVLDIEDMKSIKEELAEVLKNEILNAMDNNGLTIIKNDYSRYIKISYKVEIEVE